MIRFKLLDRVQAVLPLYVILILATVQEYSLKSETVRKTCYVFIFQLAIKVFHTLKDINNYYMADPFLGHGLLFKVLENP